MLQPRSDHNYAAAMNCVDESFRGQLNEFCTLLATPPDRGKLHATLANLSAALDRHFAAEEQEGVLSEAAAHSPRYCKQAAELLLQHPALSNSLASLRNDVNDEPRSCEWWPEFVVVADVFIRKLIDHERAENEFIREAFEPAVETRDVQGMVPSQRPTFRPNSQADVLHRK